MVQWFKTRQRICTYTATINVYTEGMNVMYMVVSCGLISFWGCDCAWLSCVGMYSLNTLVWRMRWQTYLIQCVWLSLLAQGASIRSTFLCKVAKQLVSLHNFTSQVLCKVPLLARTSSFNSELCKIVICPVRNIALRSQLRIDTLYVDVHIIMSVTYVKSRWPIHICP